MSGTLLFSGTDIASVCLATDLSDFWSSSDVRGDLAVYAGVPGSVPARRPIASRVCSGELLVDGIGLAAIEDAVAAVKAILRIGRQQTVTRRKVTGAGNLDTTQTAIVRAVAERWLGDAACTLLPSVELVDGPWYGTQESIAAVGTVTIKGDSPTRAITATLSAGAANPVVTNTSNGGYNFRYVGIVPAGGVVVDIRARRAMAGASNVSNSLKWGKDDPFQLDPGPQTLTVSAGTASFTYLPAYV